MYEGWGQPSFAKKWHFFIRKRGSICRVYDVNEIPELREFPGDYGKICYGCLLALAKLDPGRLIGIPE